MISSKEESFLLISALNTSTSSMGSICKWSFFKWVRWPFCIAVTMLRLLFAFHSTLVLLKLLIRCPITSKKAVGNSGDQDITSKSPFISLNASWRERRQFWIHQESGCIAMSCVDPIFKLKPILNDVRFFDAGQDKKSIRVEYGRLISSNDRDSRQSDRELTTLFLIMTSKMAWTSGPCISSSDDNALRASLLRLVWLRKLWATLSILSRFIEICRGTCT